MRRDRRLSTLQLLMPLLVSAPLGCAHVPQQSASLKEAELQASTAELRTRVVELGREAMHEIELAADSMDARTVDPRIRRNTLLLRLSTVSGATEAVLRDDPVIAMVDLYAFRVQLADFFSSSAGSTSLGSGTGFGERAMARLAQRWEGVAAAVGGTFTDQSRSAVHDWAQAHPITGLPFTRHSLAGDLARRLRAEQTSIGAAVGGMQESVNRLEHRVSLLNEYAVKQGMWISQYAALELSNSPEGSELTRTLTGTGNLIEAAPEIVEKERATILADVERQRLATLEVLAQERAILLQALARERTVVLEAVDEQRRRAIHDVDSLRTYVMVDAMGVVDHLMLRVTQLVGGLVAIGTLGLFVLRRRR